MDCQTCYEIIINGELSAWKGLPTNCNLTDFQKNFEPISLHKGKGFLGRKNLPAYFMKFRGLKYAQSLRVWFTEKEYLKLIEIEYPFDIDLKKLTTKIGKPLYISDYYFKDVSILKGEKIYNESGLSLMLNVDCDQIVKVLFYNPITIDRYEDEISFSTPSREFKNM